MSDPVLKARVDRLLRGDRRAEDLEAIFIALRRRSYGRSAFAEIGDFIAHRGDKNKGPLSDDLRDFYTAMRFQVLFPSLTSVDMPEGALEALAANLRRLDDATLKKATGERRKTAEAIFRSGSAKMGKRLSGRVYQLVPFSLQEKRVFDGLATTYVVRPVFTLDRLFAEFGEVLTKNGYIESRDLPKLDLAKTIIGLFALVTLHKATVIFAHGDTCSLSIQPSEDGGNLGPLTVNAEAKIGETPIHQSPIKLRFAVFATTLDPKSICGKEILDAPLPWDFPIELTANETLGRL